MLMIRSVGIVRNPFRLMSNTVRSGLSAPSPHPAPVPLTPFRTLFRHTMSRISPFFLTNCTLKMCPVLNPSIISSARSCLINSRLILVPSLYRRGLPLINFSVKPPKYLRRYPSLYFGYFIKIFFRSFLRGSGIILRINFNFVKEILLLKNLSRYKVSFVRNFLYHHRHGHPLFLRWQDKTFPELFLNTFYPEDYRVTVTSS